MIHASQRASVSISSSRHVLTEDVEAFEPPRPYGCQYARAYFPSYQNENQRRAEKAALLEFYNLCGGMLRQEEAEKMLQETFGGTATTGTKRGATELFS